MSWALFGQAARTVSWALFGQAQCGRAKRAAHAEFGLTGHSPDWCSPAQPNQPGVAWPCLAEPSIARSSPAQPITGHVRLIQVQTCLSQRSPMSGVLPILSFPFLCFSVARHLAVSSALCPTLTRWRVLRPASPSHSRLHPGPLVTSMIVTL